MNEKILIGKAGEDAAANLYLKHQFKILVRNFYNHRGKMFGEIDFIAEKNKHLHFVEIKSRTGETFGSGLEALNKLKQLRLIRTAKLFIGSLPYFSDFQAHFDLVVVEMDRFDKSVKTIKIHSDVIDDIS